jgi:hypothetical protein
MLRRHELLDELVDYTSVLEGHAALVELVTDWKRMERLALRNRKRWARKARQLRRERHELQAWEGRVAKAARLSQR